MEVNFPAEIEAYIAESVESGEFPTAEALLLAAVEQMRAEIPVLSEEELRGIEAAEAQFDAGNYVQFDVFAAEMRKKYGP